MSMRLIILRGRSTNDKMIQVVVEKKYALKNPDKLLLFLQPNTFWFYKVAYLSAPF